MIPNPDCTEHKCENLDFAILACDGIWDCLSNEEVAAWFKNALQEYDNNTFTYTPKILEESKKNNTESTMDESENNGTYIDNLKNLPNELADISGAKELSLKCVVEKFLDSIVADDSSIGIGTDNMTCILVRFKHKL